MKIALLSALILAFPAPAAATGAERPKSKGDAMICRDLAETGSRLSSKRVCMTREQWEDSRRQAQADIAYGQNRLMSACPPNTKC